MFLYFFDNIPVYSRNINDHRKHLRTVLKVLEENHLYTKHSKCKFERIRVGYLVQVITKNDILVAEGAGHQRLATS